MFREYSTLETKGKRHRIIAFYLPQYHPFEENDKWWGKGFTEWTNVTKAKPRFTGHYQPHLPTDLGFYDIRLAAAREEQAKLAKEYGIDGFCYYHYWFNGRPLMEYPLEDMLATNKPDFPFMFCWANENWTRAWDGGENNVIAEQLYSEEDDIKHIHYLLKFFKDPRYIRINGKAVICIYRTPRVPDIDKTIGLWREEARKENIELYVSRAESFRQTGSEYLTKEINGAIEFSPHITSGYKDRGKYIIKRGINKLLRTFGGKNTFIIPAIDYAEYVKFQEGRTFPQYKYYPSVTPMWDNTPRCKNRDPTVWINSSPELFGKWLCNVLRKFNPYSEEENLVFINAWNEWGEGNHLEPCIKYGRKYLEEVRRAVQNMG
jgi:lipopolysaccharide biosynthesis protein